MVAQIAENWEAIVDACEDLYLEAQLGHMGIALKAPSPVKVLIHGATIKCFLNRQ